MHSGWELTLFSRVLDKLQVLLWVKMVEAARARGIHHHPVELVLRILTI